MIDLSKPPPRGGFDYLLGPIAKPPPPPERGGGGRVRVEIEITDKRHQSPRKRRWAGAILLWLIVLAILAMAHAQQYEHWQDTNGWHGQTRTDGRTTDWDAYGPDGRQKHCHRYFVGDQPYTTCN